jgi:uncharacterized DUF497 family protein
LGLRYEWDEAKNRSNFAKHGLRFEDAELVFSGSCVTFVDDRFDYGEDLGLLVGRWWSLPTRRAMRERALSR